MAIMVDTLIAENQRLVVENRQLRTVADAAIVRSTLLQDALREHCQLDRYQQILRRIEATGAQVRAQA